MKKIDFGSDESFIKNYQELKSSRKMGELYGCDKTVVLNHAKAIGYDTKINKVAKITQYPIEQLIQDYEQLQTCKKVGEKYGCSASAVRNYLVSNGYQFSKETKLGSISDEAFIQLYQENITAKKMSELFNCSTTLILKHAREIGYDPNSHKEYKLSLADKQYILDSYLLKSSNQLATELGVSRGMITKVWYDNNLLGKEVTISPDRDLTGQTFGKWTVIAPSKKRTKNRYQYWTCRCECGIEKDIDRHSLVNHLSLSCGSHFNVSKGNEKIKELLQKENIPFEIEKKFSTCKDKTYLPFDFFVDNHYLIEYDGIQHFQESIFDYEYTHAHDLIKNQWCKDNDYTLIRIPYTQYDNLTIEDLLIPTSDFVIHYADHDKSSKIGEPLQLNQGNTEVSN